MMDKLIHPILRQKNAPVIDIKDPSYCFYCGTSFNAEANLPCGACGFPQTGIEQDQKKFVAHKRILLGDLEAMREQIGKVRGALWATGTVYMLNYGLQAFQSAHSTAAIIEGSIIAGIFLGLGFLARKQPFAAALAGVIVFGLLVLFSAIAGPFGIFAGLIWKLAAFAALALAWKAARDHDTFRDKLLQNHIDLNAKL
jgi:hypothetical protein